MNILMNQTQLETFSPNSAKFDVRDYYKQLRKQEPVDKFIDYLTEGPETYENMFLMSV